VSILGEHELPNGRRYRVTDTGRPYECGEYEAGGLLLLVWTANQWVYLNNCPDEECVRNFLRAAGRLPRIEG
jgi:hypothetical protein